MKIRKLLAAALVLIMVLAAIPVFSLAEGARIVTNESRQMSKLDRVWAQLEAVEAQALSSRISKNSVIQAVYNAALNLKDVDKDSFADFTKDGFFFTVDGMQCSYNYRLNNELKPGATPVPANEGIQVFKPETTVEYERAAGNTPDSPNVLLVAPYYGHDYNFTDQYKNEAQSIANTTGGTYTLIQSTQATGPQIAVHMPDKGVVIWDSHGIQTGTSSYLCLTTNSGITANDLNNGWAVSNSSSSAYIDGRYIQNHAIGNLGNCFVWMAMCEGMKKGGGGKTGTALLNKGAGGVYGYSQNVSFGGDYRYEATFWTQMKQGKTVAEAIQVMKNNHTIPDGSARAYPIVMSATDPFPANPDSNQNVTCTWKLIGGGSSNAITSVTLSSVSVAVGATKKATLTVQPSNANYSVTWSTYNSSIATVDNSGNVRGVSAGTTTLSAYVYDNVAGKSYSRTATITVTGGSNPTPTPTPAPGNSYERVYSIENGGKYIIVADSSVSGSTGYAVGNTVVSNNRYLTPVAITINGSYASVSSGVNAITWTASGSSSAGWTFKNVGNNKYMGLDSAQYLYPSNTSVAWKYTSSYGLDNQIDTDGYYYLSYSSGKYTTSKSSTAIRLYKVASGTVTPTPTPTAAPNTYTVTFKDWDGTVLKTQQVSYGGYATPPANPTRPGYTFTGWDRSYSYITANTVITALYTQNYTNPTPTPTPGGTTRYERVYTITSGAKYIIIADSSVSGTTGYAVGNTVVSNNHYLNTVAVTVNSNATLTIPSNVNVNAITWVASGSSSAGWTFRNVGNSKYMGLDSAQYLYPSNTAIAWKFTSSYGLDNQVDTDGYYYLSYSTGRYTTSKTSSIIRLYKVVEG